MRYIEQYDKHHTPGFYIWQYGFFVDWCDCPSHRRWKIDPVSIQYVVCLDRFLDWQLFIHAIWYKFVRFWASRLWRSDYHEPFHGAVWILVGRREQKRRFIK